MLKAIGHNALLTSSLLLGAWVSGSTAAWVVSARGAAGPALLQADALGGALAASAVSLVTGTVLAVLVGRVINTAVGMFALGGSLFGLAWRMDAVDEVVRSGSMGMLTVETLLWAVAVFLATLVVFKFAGPLRDVEPDEEERVPHPILSAAAAKSAAMGVLVLPVVWLVGQSNMPGQAMGAAFMGAMVAGLVGRLVSPHVQPILLFATPIVFGAVGQTLGLSLLGSTTVEEALRDGTLSHFLAPMPVVYAAASCTGVAFGFGWAKSFLHHEEDDRASQTHASA